MDFETVFQYRHFSIYIVFLLTFHSAVINTFRLAPQEVWKWTHLLLVTNHPTHLIFKRCPSMNLIYIPIPLLNYHSHHRRFRMFPLPLLYFQPIPKFPCKLMLNNIFNSSSFIVTLPKRCNFKFFLFPLCSIFCTSMDEQVSRIRL